MLIDLFPRAGFHWKHTRGGPPRIMCRDSRDAKVQRALIELNGPERKMQKRDAQVIIVDAINTVAEAYASPQHAIRASEGILRFLRRASTFCKLASMMPQDVWIELLYEITEARERYELDTMPAQKLGDLDQLPELAHAVDHLLTVANRHWKRSLLGVYVHGAATHGHNEQVGRTVEEVEDWDLEVSRTWRLELAMSRLDIDKTTGNMSNYTKEEKMEGEDTAMEM